MITFVGGVVLAVGIVGTTIRHHMTIDYPIFDRLNALESKFDEDWACQAELSHDHEALLSRLA